MRVIKFMLGITMIIFLFACSTVETVRDVEAIQQNNDILAQFAFEDRIYSLEGNKTPSEKIIKEIGEIHQITDEITKNGEGKLFKSEIKLSTGTKVYSVKDVNQDTVVAVKIDDLYYTAFFTRELK